jgi:hypothetical protein
MQPEAVIVDHIRTRGFLSARRRESRAPIREPVWPEMLHSQAHKSVESSHLRMKGTVAGEEADFVALRQRPTEGRDTGNGASGSLPESSDRVQDSQAPLRVTAARGA